MRRMKHPTAVLWLSLPAFFCFLHSCPAQDAGSRHAAATNQLQKLAARMTQECLQDVQTAEDWARLRPVYRTQLLYMLGLDPLPARTPLRSRITSSRDEPGYRVENLVFESLPKLHVTANFYLPRDRSGRVPVILYLCGHSAHPDGSKTQYLDRILWYATHGYAVLALDTLEFGEVPGIHHGTHNLNQWHWLSLGYTPAGTETWNAMRALDWLQLRPEVDMERVGVTGISGGGAITWYLAALDSRVAVAAPSCSTFTFGSQAAHWLASGQCDCIYYHNIHRWDFPVLAALIAPRPLLMTSGQRDSIFPPDGYREVFRQGKRIYGLLPGMPLERIAEVDADVGHSDPPEFLAASRAWMNRWLRHDPGRVSGDPAAGSVPTTRSLRVLEGFPPDALNFRIHNELTQPRPLKPPRSRREWSQRRGQVERHLRDRVFPWFPKDAAPFETQTLKGGGGWAGRYVDYREASIQTEEGVRIRAQVFPASADFSSKGVPLVVVVKRPGDSVYGSDFDELLPLMGRAHLLVLSPRFTERDMTAREFVDVERTAAWVGRTISAMQVWDVLRGVDWALGEQRIPASRVFLHGRGSMAGIAVYAAFFDSRISDLVLGDPPQTHWQGPALLNLLRETDLPEVMAVLSPRRVQVLGSPGRLFDFSRAVGRLDGRLAVKWRQAGSLPEAVLSGVVPQGRGGN